jgi:hypothetical protein
LDVADARNGPIIAAEGNYMKMRDIISAGAVITKLGNSANLSADGLLVVSRLLVKMEPEVRAFERARVALLERHGQKNGEPIASPEVRAAIESDFDNILDQEIGPLQVKTLSLADAQAAGLTPAEVAAAPWLFDRLTD